MITIGRVCIELTGGVYRLPGIDGEFIAARIVHECAASDLDDLIGATVGGGVVRRIDRDCTCRMLPEMTLGLLICDQAE